MVTMILFKGVGFEMPGLETYGCLDTESPWDIDKRIAQKEKDREEVLLREFIKKPKILKKWVKYKKLNQLKR